MRASGWNEGIAFTEGGGGGSVDDAMLGTNWGILPPNTKGSGEGGGVGGGVGDRAGSDGGGVGGGWAVLDADCGATSTGAGWAGLPAPATGGGGGGGGELLSGID